MPFGIESAFKGAVGAILNSIQQAFSTVLTLLIEDMLVPLITTSPVPRGGSSNMPMFHIPFKNASKCTEQGMAVLAEQQCKMWSSLYHGVYKFGATKADIGVLTMAIIFLVLSFATVKTLEAFNVFEESALSRSGNNSTHERFTYAFLGIILWWPIGTTILYFTDILASVLAATGSLGMDPSSISAGEGVIATATIGIIIYSLGTVMILAVTLFWVIRFILLVVLMTIMPVIISIWTLDVKQIDFMSKTASSMMDLFVILAFAPVPAGLVLYAGGVVGSIATALPGGGIIQVIAYVAFPFMAGITPFFMFKDEMTDRLGGELASQLGVDLGDKLDEVLDADKLQSNIGTLGAGAKSAIEGEYYGYDENEGVYQQIDPDDAGIVSSIGEKTRSATESIGKGVRIGHTAAVDSYHNTPEFKKKMKERIGEKMEEGVKTKVVRSAKNRNQELRERNDSVTANVASIAASKGVSNATKNPLDEINEAYTGVNKSISELKEGQRTIPLKLLDEKIESKLKEGERQNVRGRMDDLRDALRSEDPSQVQNTLEEHTGETIEESTAQSMIDASYSETEAFWDTDGEYASGEKFKQYGKSLDPLEGRLKSSDEVDVGKERNHINMDVLDDGLPVGVGPSASSEEDSE